MFNCKLDVIFNFDLGHFGAGPFRREVLFDQTKKLFKKKKRAVA